MRTDRRFQTVVWTFLLLVAAAPTAVAGFDSPRVTARKSVELLPEPIAEMFRRRIADLEERAVEPDAVWPRDKERRDRALWHRVAMDVDAEEQNKEARIAAAAHFPFERSDAKRLYGKLNKRGGNGFLIWAIEDLFNELTTAFREGTEDDIVRSAGYLAHFAADAACPFHATINHDGKLTGNLDLGRVRMGKPEYPHRDVRARFDGELLRRNRSRYIDILSLSPGDCDPVRELVPRTRAVLLAGLADVDTITQADAEVIEFMEITEGQQLLDRADEYYTLLDERCGDIRVQRLEQGIAFAANLISGAWLAAGKPSVEEIRGRSGTVTEQPQAELTSSETAAPPVPAANQSGPIVGSRHSNIYHKRGCTFAKQIAPDNLVTFAGIEEAKADGRRACRACKP